MAESANVLPVKIVVIEDNPGDVLLLRMAFEQARFECEMTVLNDGADALALFRQKPGTSTQFVPDLAVLDLNLPKHDGTELLEAARGNAMFAQMPVAILSSSPSPQERSSLPAFHRVCYITKPPELEQYLSIGTVIRDFYLANQSK